MFICCTNTKDVLQKLNELSELDEKDLELIRFCNRSRIDIFIDWILENAKTVKNSTVQLFLNSDQGD